VVKFEVKRIGQSQIEIQVTIPHRRVGEEFEKVLEEAAKKVEIEGFRKGHAPKDLVRKKIDRPKAYGEVVNRLVTTAYNEAVKQHFLKPIVSPRIELLQFEPEANKDLIFKATTTERPEVTLGDYKTKLAKLPAKGWSASGRKVQIVGPDGQPLKSPSANGGSPNTQNTPTLNDVLQAVLKTSKVEVPKILLENEVNRKLSQLIDQTGRLGLTVEQYLQSQGKTAEQLRAEYTKQTEETLKVELVLDEIAKAEKIEVTDQEVEEAIKANPDEKSRKELAKEENRWYIKSIIRRNKTIQRLLELTK
jgi:trigger factor